VTVTLYLDVFFLVNFGMDYLLLLLVKHLLRQKTSWFHLAVGAFIGAVWACVDLLVLSLSGWQELIMTWIVIGGAMVFFAFGGGCYLKQQSKEKRGRWFKDNGHIIVCLVTFWMVSVMAGGIFSALGGQTAAGIYLTGTRAVRQWSLVPFCFWVAGICFGLYAFTGFIRRWSGEQKRLVQVRLSYQGKEVIVTALRDTGNQLHEPYGGKPVHVITKEVCKKLCPTLPKLIYIPFRTVGIEYGMMPGIRIDFMEVVKEGKVVRHMEHPWLAISKRPLSMRHQYEMLLNGEEGWE
jgi:stage II sporulation protein GA (sporulation sigma-E factor processing peptidase)